ncbi:MAG: glycosyltransferase family 2 protein [Lachnospiraceae bacterium]|nr:glycosyltransferase family 2 protein [Lachnospiraceae bacterium]
MRFSIITPFYKGNKYVHKLIEMAEQNLESLRKASIEAELELIIVNDSPEIEVELTANSKEIELVVLKHEKNSGIQQARVTGLQNSSGEYIVFLDQDDEIVADCLLQEYITMQDADVVVSNLLFEHSKGNAQIFYKSRGQFKNVFSLQAYTKGHNRIISPGHCMIRKSCIPNEWITNIMKVNGSDDLFLWILLLIKKHKFVMYEKPLYIHKYTGGNLSAEVTKMDKSSLEMADILKRIDYVPNNVIKDIVRSRSLSLKMENLGMMKKFLFVISNIDLYLCRIFWKLREYSGLFSNKEE